MVMNHTHTYVRYTKDKFRCAAPKCYHFIDKKVLVGKASICNECGREFILTREDLRRSKPRCIDCSNTKRSKAKEAASSLFDILLGRDEVQE